MKYKAFFSVFFGVFLALTAVSCDNGSDSSNSLIPFVLKSEDKKPDEPEVHIAIFKVLPLLQNRDGTYKESEDLSYKESGITGITTNYSTASAKDIENYEAKKVENAEIKNDNSTVVKIYYDRVTVTIKSSNTDFSASGLPGESYIKPENPADKDGKKFLFWMCEDGKYGLPDVIPENDTRVTAVFESDTEKYATYKVQFFIDCKKDEPFKEETYVGKVGEGTNVEPISIAGHSINVETIKNDIIKEDGSTIVKMEYFCNEFEMFFLNGTTILTTIKGHSGSTYTKPKDPKLEGKEFSHWHNELGEIGLPDTIPYRDSYYYASWKMQEGDVFVDYKVNHYLSKVDTNEFEIYVTETLKGLEGNMTKAKEIIIEGAKLRTRIEDAQKKIEKDGSTVVDFYYVRNGVVLTFEGFPSQPNATTTLYGNYGDTIPEINLPLETGKVFVRWDPELPKKFPAANMTFKAVMVDSLESEKVIDYVKYEKTGEKNIINISFTVASEPEDFNGKGVFSPKSEGYEIAPYAIGKYEVTQQLFNRVMGYNNSICSKYDSKYSLLSDENTDLRPVENVTWYEAIVFCNKLSKIFGLEPCYNFTENDLDTVDWSTAYAWEKEKFEKYSNVVCNKTKNGYRLPTEEEWELAARGGDFGNQENWKMVYSGSDSNVRDRFSSFLYDSGMDKCGWYLYNLSGKTKNYHLQVYNNGYGTHEAGKKEANSLGIYDMSGNVWEWTNDSCVDDSVSEKVYRGGAWNSSSVNCSVSTQHHEPPYIHGNAIGFRVARRIILE